MSVIQQQRGTAAALTATNPVIADGQIVYETDTGKTKIGDGVTAWASLPYTKATPTAHKTSHATGGSDAIAPSDIGAVATTDTRLASNGNKGDITVASNGASWTINAGAVVTADIADSAVTDAKINDVAASKLTGTIAAARLPAATTSTAGAVTVGSGLNVASGTISATASSVGAAASTHASQHGSGGSDPVSLAASQITSGTLAAARLGSGTTDATTYLRGDSTFAAAVTSVDGATGAVTISKATVLDFTVSSAPSGFTGSSGSWSGSLPTGWKFIDAIIIGNGGGGGSGRSDSSSVTRGGGGGGGGGGGITIARVSAADFSSNSLSVVVRSGSAGGAAVTGTGDGQAGSPLNSSTTTATIGGTLVLEAQGGTSGSGGTSSAGGAFGSGRPSSNLGVGRFVGNNGANGGFAAVGGADNRGAYYSLYQKGGGGGGGCGNATQFAGGLGGLPCGELCGYENANQPAAGTAGGGAGGNAPAGTGLRVVGASGGGGGGSASGAGGKGGDALNYGGGGGGGGAGTAGAGGSGAGGNGGPGFVRLVVWS